MPYINNNVSMVPPLIFGDNNNFKIETFKKDLDDGKISFEISIAPLN